VSNIPNHLLADIRDGMNPTSVYAVYCTQCERYIGDYRRLSYNFDPDTILCGGCEEELEEREPTEEELWDFKRRVFRE